MLIYAWGILPLVGAGVNISQQGGCGKTWRSVYTRGGHQINDVTWVLINKIKSGLM